MQLFFYTKIKGMFYSAYYTALEFKSVMTVCVFNHSLTYFVYISIFSSFTQLTFEDNLSIKMTIHRPLVNEFICLLRRGQFFQ